MINRFRWLVCCALIFIMQFVLSTTDGKAGSTSSTPEKPDPILLQVVQNTGRGTVAQGELINYELTVLNTSAVTVASNVRIMNIPPPGFRYKKGSVKLNGITAPDPLPSSDGQAMIFLIGTLATKGSATIRFETEVTAASTPGKAINYASAISSGGGKSNATRSTVQVGDGNNPVKVDSPLPPVVAVATIKSAPPKEILPPAVKKTTEVTVPATIPDPPAVPPVPAATVKASAPKEIPPPATIKTSEATAPAAAAPPVVLPAPATANQPVAASSASSSQSASPQTPNRENTPPATPITSEAAATEAYNLAKLAGMAEVAVLSDVDGQYVKSMSGNQILENEFASLVTETTLLDSIRVGRSFNRESRAASARTEQAKAQTGQAFALLMPSVAVRASYGSETSKPSVKTDETTGKPVSSDTHPRTDASLTVRQPLFDLPSFMDWQRRKAVEQARGENYRVSDGDAYISTANAYLTLVSSRLQIDMTRDFESQLNDLLSYVEKRAKAGAASVSDMARVRARSQATLSARLEQESAHAAAGIEFVRLTNLVPRKVRIPELDDVGASHLPKSFETAVSTAMKSNPEVAALNAEIQAAKIDLTNAKSRFMPRVDAEYTDTYSLHAGGDTSSAGQRDQRVMMVLNWSLFNGGSDYNNHVERTARHKELQYRLDDQRRRVVQTLSANYATLTTTRERISSGYQELKSISTAADAMSKRMLSGNQSLLDLLDVYDRYYQVRSRLVNLHILEMSTVAQLVRLTRGAPGSASDVITEPATTTSLKKPDEPVGKK